MFSPRQPPNPPRPARAFTTAFAGLAVAAWAACTGANPAYRAPNLDNPPGFGAAGGGPAATGGQPGPGGALGSGGDLGTGGGAPGTGGLPPGTGGSTGAGGSPADAADGPLPPDTGRDAPPSTVDLATGLVGYWRLDDGPGYGAIPDESGLGQTANLFGIDTETAWLAGRFSRALRFGDNASDHLWVSPTAQLQGLARFTIAAWINRAGNDTRSMSVLAQQQSGDAQVFRLHCANGVLSFDHRNSANTLGMSSTRPCPLNQWTHVAVTHDGSQVSFYVAGELVRTVDRTGPLVTSANRLILGNANTAAGMTGSFVGAIDELLIYNRALPPAAIKALADGQQPASKRL